MIFDMTDKSFAIAFFSTLLLTACGGGGAGSGNNNNNNQNNNSSSATELQSTNPESKRLPDEIPGLAHGENEPLVVSNEVPAALLVNNEISMARTQCGLNGLSVDAALDDIAIQHANYIKHVFTSATPTKFNPHLENKIADIVEVTGENNPFFSGVEFKDRLLKAGYPNLRYGVAENISRPMYYTSAGNIEDVKSEVVAHSMVKSLLAAPYHLRSLMIPASSLTGTSVTSYTPFGKNANNYKDYILVNHTAATSVTRNTKVEGVFTYPCQGITNTITALYNETPNPFAGTGRNLRLNPIGQPIYINVPSAQKIEVSNISFYDVERNIKIPTLLLDHRQDPHKDTLYELPANEAFILPLTDALNSCKAVSKQRGNCGLYSDSEYQVSFDILVDSNNLQSQAFTFKTGNVND